MFLARLCDIVQESPDIVRLNVAVNTRLCIENPAGPGAAPRSIAVEFIDHRLKGRLIHTYLVEV